MTKGQWKKELGPRSISDRDFFILAIPILFVMGMFYSAAIFYIMIGVLITYVLVNYFYNRTVGNKLYLKSPRETIRIFQGDKSEFIFEFNHASYLPMMHGQMRFEITPVISPLEGDIVEDGKSYAFHKTFSIKGRGKTIVRFPFKGERRGVTRLRNITYSFPHLFNFNVLTLKYLPFTMREVVVFPKPLQVENVEVAFQNSPGDHRVPLSPYEEIQSIISIRDYEYSDPFHRINWKASAKSQKLQTNIYEKVVDLSYIFLVNIRDSMEAIQLNEQMERILSYTTYLCHEAHEREISYEMYVNARTQASIPFLKLPEGKGRAHYIKSLELLARIPRHSMNYSFAEMAYRVQKNVVTPKTIVIIGDIPEDAVPILSKWSQVQKDIFQVVPYENGAVMERWQRGVSLHA